MQFSTRIAALAVGIVLILSPLATAADEKEVTPLRAAVKDAVKALEKSETDFQMMEEFVAVPAVQLILLKKQIETVQKDRVGDAFFHLAKVAEELEERKEQRDKESRYWQANYDFVLAQLYTRQARILEYNVMLGKIRRDDLPDLNPQLHKGWYLKAKEKLSDRDARECADKARELYKRLAEEHKGTPWEMIAKKEGTAPLGLEWVPLGR
jgi:hypothetical protein